MLLFTCELGKSFASPPGPLAHPCGRAAKALDLNGHEYEQRTVKGGSLKFWTWPSRAKDRREVEQLSGQRSVPILVLDDGNVITGSARITEWAQENQAAV